MKHYILFLLVSTSIQAQVGIGNNTPEATLDIQSSDSGILIPRVALTGTDDTTTITSPVENMLIYNTSTIDSGDTSVVRGVYVWKGIGDWRRATIDEGIGIDILSDGKACAESVFLGINSGNNSTGVYNVSLGHESSNSITTGTNNTILGAQASFFNESGVGNTIVGYRAGYGASGQNPSGNVLLGFQAGYNEANNNKLYIENSNADSSAALIYGEFDNDLLRFNGDVEVKNSLRVSDAYTFPTVDGTSNQIMVTNGAGTLSWQPAPAVIDEIDDLLDAIADATDVFIGEGSGINHQPSGINNTAIGIKSMGLLDNGDRNVAVGEEALYSNQFASDNVAVGYQALFNATLGGNIAVGTSSLHELTTGQENIGIGHDAANHLISGDFNVILGYHAGLYNETGSDNVMIGHNAGRGTSGISQSGTVFIGNSAGENEENSDRLYIENTNSSSPLIGGQFDTDRVGINRPVASLSNTFEVGGTASKAIAGDWIANSDRRLKKNIKTFDSKSALDKLMKLRGVSFKWNDNQTGIERPNGIHYGFIAQEVMKVFPENVSKDNQGFYQTAYGTYDALYVQAIKEQQTQIDILNKKILKLEKLLSKKFNSIRR